MEADRLIFSDPPSALAALTVMTRLAQRCPAATGWLRQAIAERLDFLAEVAIAVASETGDPAGLELARALDEQRNGEVVERLYDRLGTISRLSAAVPVREAAWVVTAQRVALLRERAASRPDAIRREGRKQEALAAIQEAVAIRRVLAASLPDAFRPDLAISLSNLSNRLSDLDRLEEALAAAEQAVEIRRALATSRPDAFRPDLAMSLNNLSVALSDLGRKQEALTAIQEAVAIRRMLAASLPDSFCPDLAISLNNLSVQLRDINRREHALAASKEAARTLAPYCKAEPNAFLRWMKVIARNYHELVDASGEIDPDLDSILNMAQ